MAVAANKIAWVAAAVGNVNGVEAVTVGRDVTVGGAVFVAGGAIAVWVSKTAATMVCAPAATVRFISGVASAAAGWPPQEANNIPMSSIASNDRRVMIHLMCE